MDCANLIDRIMGTNRTKYILFKLKCQKENVLSLRQRLYTSYLALKVLDCFIGLIELIINYN